MSRLQAEPPHAPVRGWSNKVLGRLHLTGVFWYRIHLRGLALLPGWMFWLLVPLMTSFFFVVLRRNRAALASNLERALGPCGWFERQQRIFRTMYSFAWCLNERYERLTGRPAAPPTLEGKEWFDAALSQPKGAILATAHIGHWEIGSLLATARRIHVVREEERDAAAQQMIAGLYADLPGEGYVLHFAGKDPLLGAKLLSALRCGDLVALQADRPRTGGRTVCAELFENRIALPAGPAALARAAEVPILPVFVFRRGRRESHLSFRPFIHVAEPGARGLATATRELASQIEWAIRKEPHQWFCFRELWPRATVAGEASPDRERAVPRVATTSPLPESGATIDTENRASDGLERRS